ncbi:hypothetical protein N2152v2_008821 [Parachlorella kessleri]
MVVWQSRLSFSSPDLERRYQAAQNVKFASRELGVAFFSNIIEKRYPQFSAQYRTWWVTAIRLALVFLPIVPVRAQRGHTTAHLLGMVAVAAHVPRMWVSACELRLAFRTHLALNALQSVHVVFSGAYCFCSSSYAQTPAALGGFVALSHQCSLWSGLLAPLQLPPGSPQSPGLSTGHDCVALMVAVHLIFGLYLSSVAVYVSERLDRADFLLRQAADLGLAPSQASEQLGLPREEVAEVCLFDPTSEWLRWGMLLPPLAAATWLGLAALVPLEAGDP